jgi:hypothetical protein
MRDRTQPLHLPIPFTRLGNKEATPKKVKSKKIYLKGKTFLAESSTHFDF